MKESGRIAAVLVVFALLPGVQMAGLCASTLIPTEDRFAAPREETVLRLSLADAIGVFLDQNLDLLMTRYGIDSALGKRITARLFPNPVMTLDGFGSVTQNQTLSRTRGIAPRIEQLFEVAGKRGYRIERAEHETRSALAKFENTVRQLGFAVKDTYMQVQLAEQQLKLAEANRDRFTEILRVNRVRFQKGFIPEVELMRIGLQRVDFDTQVIRFLRESEEARQVLRNLLGISPMTELVLTTPLTYQQVDPDLSVLKRMALDSRPDLQDKRLIKAQLEAEFKLAQALRYPDVTAGGGIMLQAPEGPDNQQQIGMTLSVPLPLFDRNQGGIVQVEAAVRTADATITKILIQIQNEVETAYRNLLSSRRLVDAYRVETLDEAREILAIAEKAYEKGAVTVLELLDAARTEARIEQNYLDAIYEYERNRFLLERAIARPLP